MKETQTDTGMPTILVAEDEEYNFMYISELLRRQNINIIRAYNGKMAVDLCASNMEIQLVLMDVSMPILDGYEATARIKEIRPDLPVIINTSYTTQSDKVLAFESGCDCFLTKPIERTKLQEVIHELLVSKQVRQQ